VVVENRHRPTQEIREAVINDVRGSILALRRFLMILLRW